MRNNDDRNTRIRATGQPTYSVINVNSLGYRAARFSEASEGEILDGASIQFWIILPGMVLKPNNTALSARIFHPLGFHEVSVGLRDTNKCCILHINVVGSVNLQAFSIVGKDASHNFDVLTEVYEETLLIPVTFQVFNAGYFLWPISRRVETNSYLRRGKQASNTKEPLSVSFSATFVQKGPKLHISLYSPFYYCGQCCP
jgi:hypothetical protein